VRVESHDGVSDGVRRGSLCVWSHMMVLVMVLGEGVCAGGVT